MPVNLVTAEGLEAMKAELAALEQHRPEIKARLEEARSRGDLSENAEYHAAREELAMLESKVRELEDRLRDSRVVDAGTAPEDMVMIGDTVMCVDTADDTEQKFMLVGDGERTGPAGDLIRISVSSPIGESLFKAKVGQEIVVKAPRGRMRFLVKEILS